MRRMLRCFRAQTYRDKELILVYESLDPAARELLAADGDAVSLVHVSTVPKQPLGALRNLGIRASRGKYVCGWDDDDWYAPRRLEAQLEHLIGTRADACVLRRWLMFDETRGQAYVSAPGTWEGSLICPRDLPALQQGYPPLPRGEDSVLIEQLTRRHRLVHLDRPELYVYTFHGQNTWEQGHFEGLFQFGQGLAAHDTERLRALLSGGVLPPTAARQRRPVWRPRFS